MLDSHHVSWDSTENVIQHVKAIATKVARLRPDFSSKIVMALAVQCCMEE